MFKVPLSGTPLKRQRSLDHGAIRWLRLLANYEGDLPAPRGLHGACTASNCLWVFGGCVNDEGTGCVNDEGTGQSSASAPRPDNQLWVYNISAARWFHVPPPAAPTDAAALSAAAGDGWPCPRTSASLVALGPDDLYLFGGFDPDSAGFLGDFWHLDAKLALSQAMSGGAGPSGDHKSPWRLVTPAGACPSARDKHSAVVDVHDASRMWLFGGFGPAPGADSWGSMVAGRGGGGGGGDGLTFVRFNDLYSFSGGVWRQHELVGEVPPPVCAASLCIVDSALMLFGGRQADGRVNHLFSIDLPSPSAPSTTTASAIGASSAPPAATSTASSCPTPSSPSAEAHSSSSSMKDAGPLRVRRVRPLGTSPSPRSFHVAASVGKRSQMIVFGGIAGGAHDGDEDEVLCDLFVYDPEKNAFLQPSTSGPLSTSVGNFEDLVAGDSSGDEDNSGGASDPRGHLYRPRGRAYASLVTVEPSGHVMLFGGFTAFDPESGQPTGWCNDLWIVPPGPATQASAKITKY